MTRISRPSCPTIWMAAASACAALAHPAAAQVTDEMLQAERDWFRAKNHFLCSSVSFARADGEAGRQHMDAGFSLGQPIVEETLEKDVTPQTLLPHLRGEAQILATSPDTTFALGRIYQEYELLFARKLLEQMEGAAERQDDRDWAAAQFLEQSYNEMGCAELLSAD